VAVVGDLYDIDRRVRELYPDLRIYFDPKRALYIVKRVRRALEDLGGKLLAAIDVEDYLFAWPAPLDSRLIQYLRYSDSWSGHRNIRAELEEADYRRQRRREKQEEEFWSEFRKDVERAFKKDLGF